MHFIYSADQDESKYSNQPFTHQTILILITVE